MPRRPKPKNTLSAGERAAMYESEQREKLAKFNDRESPSEKQVIVKETVSVAATGEVDKIASPAKETRRKVLPKPQKAVVKVDFSVPVGKVKPMHGMCNGPVSYGADISHLFKEIGVPCVRFDCTDTPMSGYAVDISRIFRNLEADPYDEANYDFAVTDKYVEAARLAGAEIILRLGESRDIFSPDKVPLRPRDLDALARICVNVIRHYNDRWAKGYSLGITHIELWNVSQSEKKEALAEDMEIYRRLAGAVKLYDESLYVGGMSFCTASRAGEFLRFCKKNRVPVDFITLDLFGNDPAGLTGEAGDVIGIARNLGFGELEVFAGKWAMSDGERLGDALADNERGMLKDAAFSGAVLLGLGNLDGVSGAFAYDAQPGVSPWCGIADRQGRALKPFYVFKAYGELYRAGESVLCECLQADGCAHNGIYASAATSDDGRCYLMITSYDGCNTVDVRLDGIPDNVYEAEVFMLDGVKNMDSSGSVTVSGGKKRIVLNVSAYGVFLIKLF